MIRVGAKAGWTELNVSQFRRQILHQTASLNPASDPARSGRDDSDNDGVAETWSRAARADSERGCSRPRPRPLRSMKRVRVDEGPGIARFTPGASSAPGKRFQCFTPVVPGVLHPGGSRGASPRWFQGCFTPAVPVHCCVAEAAALPALPPQCFHPGASSAPGAPGALPAPSATPSALLGADGLSRARFELSPRFGWSVRSGPGPIPKAIRADSDLRAQGAGPGQ